MKNLKDVSFIIICNWDSFSVKLGERIIYCPIRMEKRFVPFKIAKSSKKIDINHNE